MRLIRRELWAVALVAVGLFHYGPDWWWSKWAVALFLIAAGLSAGLVGLSPVFALAFFYTSVSGLFVFAWRETYVADLDRTVATALDANSAYSLVAFLFLCISASLAADSGRAIRRALGIVCLADSLHTVAGMVAGHFSRTSVGGFFDEYSINGCFVAVTLPFALELVRTEWRSLFLTLLPFASMLASGYVGLTRSVFGVFWVVAVTLELMAIRPLKLRLLRAGAITALTVALLYFAFGLRSGSAADALASAHAAVAHTSGRSDIAGVVFEWFLSKPGKFWLFGFGNGSFQVLGPQIQIASNYQADGHSWFLWLHSDWLQTVFELGLVGVAIYLALAIACVRRALERKDPALVAAVLGFAATALFQFPVHLPLFAFVGATLVAMCFSEVALRAVPGRQ